VCEKGERKGAASALSISRGNNSYVHHSQGKVKRDKRLANNSVRLRKNGGERRAIDNLVETGPISEGGEEKKRASRSRTGRDTGALNSAI